MAVILLDGLQRVRVAAVDDVGPRVEGGVALGYLLGVDGIAALVAPVKRGDDELRPLVPQCGYAGLYLVDGAEADCIDAYLQSAFGLL